MMGNRSDDNDRGGNRDRAETRAPTCPYCELPMYKRHCKYVCPQHGVVIDCSDPFR